MPIAAVASGLQRAPAKVGKEETILLRENHHSTKIRTVLLSQAVRVRMKERRENLFLPNDFPQTITEEARGRKTESTLQKSISLCVAKGEAIVRKTTIELQVPIVQIEKTDPEEKAVILNHKREVRSTEAEVQTDPEEKAESTSLGKEVRSTEAEVQIDPE